MRRVINELRGRFNKAIDAGDDSYVPADLITATYRAVCSVSMPASLFLSLNL